MGGGHDAFGTADWSTTITGLVAGQSYVLNFETASETTSLPQSMTVSFISGSSTGPVVVLSPLSGTSNYWRTWGSHSETFVATSTSAVVDFSASTSQDEGLDDVTVALAPSMTPEPSSLLLLATGLLGLARSFRRKLMSRPSDAAGL
jgi:PEP-CTERM motif